MTWTIKLKKKQQKKPPRDPSSVRSLLIEYQIKCFGKRGKEFFKNEESLVDS